MFNTTLIEIHTQFKEEVHPLIQENRKLKHEVVSLNIKLQEQDSTHSRLKEYVNEKLKKHHQYHATDLPWFWQDLHMTRVG